MMINRERLTWATAVMALASGSGASVALAPHASVLLTAAAVIVAWVLVRGNAYRWDAFRLALFGAFTLGYGFANIGISGATPMPVADLIIFVVFVSLVFTQTGLGSAGLVVGFGAIYTAWATCRLVIDYPTWGSSAIRDYTLPLEIAVIPVSYWLATNVGHARWIGMWRKLILPATAYFLTIPFSGYLRAISPSVGLQRSVPLLGDYSSAGTAAATLVFFLLLLRPYGRWSYIFAAAFFGILGLLQTRGLYLSVPLAFGFVWALDRGRDSAVRRRLATGLACALAGLALVSLLGLSGRFGRVSPVLIKNQIETLFGGAGPGSGSLQKRREFYSVVFNKLEARPYRWIVGVGLGPDLSGGFHARSGAAVRKPHNDYLEALGRLGLLGLVPFCAMLFVALRRLIRAARTSSHATAQSLWWVVASSAVYLMNAATQPLLAFPYGTLPLFALIGGGLALVDSDGLRGRAE